MNTPDRRLVRLRRAFTIVDIGFNAAWLIWVPTFYIFLQDSFGGSGYSEFVVTAALVWWFLLEVTLGAVADIIPGLSSFVVACLFNILSCVMYAFLPVLHLYDFSALSLLGFAMAAEFIGGIGQTAYSGAFDRWFQGTLELAGMREGTLSSFARLRVWRAFAATVAGLLSLTVLYPAASRGLIRGDVLATYVWQPHFWAAIIGALTLVYALSVRADLQSQTVMSVAGTDANVATGKLSFLAGLSDRAHALSRFFRAIESGWLTFVGSGRLRSTVYGGASVQLTLTVLAFLVPYYLWQTSTGRARIISLGTYWVATRATRAAASRWASQTATTSLNESAESSVRLIGALGFAFVVAGCVVWYPAPPEWVGVVRTSTMIALGVAAFSAIGLLEPHQDAIAFGYSPPDLRALVLSIRSAVGLAISSLFIPPIFLVSRWYGGNGEYAFWALFLATGSVLCSLALLSVRRQNPVQLDVGGQ